MASKKLMIKNTKKYDKYKKNVENFSPLIDSIEQSNLKRNTKVTKITHLTLYCCSQDKYLHDLLNEAKREEKSIEKLSDRKIGQRLDDFEQYLKDVGYAERTIRDRVKTVRSFYRGENITLPAKDLRPLINPKLREEIKNSKVFQDFIEERKLTNESTIGGYLTSLTGYCDYHGMSIEELVEEAEQEEDNGIRLKKRKIKKRLIEYRNYLYDKKYSNKTIKSKMSDIIFFFDRCEIEIPKLGRKENVPYDRSISFDEVPKKEHVKKAIETTTSIKNRALYLFCMSSCSGSAEAREFTIEEYIRGVKGIPDNIDITDINIEEVLDEVEKDLNESLENPQEQNESIVPVFHFVRKKKKRDYFTCITPEANQYIINYLKTREGLTLEDKVFDYSRKSLIRAFQSVNDKNNWGWINRDRQRFFTSHQLRRLGANLIEDEKLVNQISGRKFDETTEAYFKRDKTKIRKEYFKWLDELTIYQKYRINFMTDEKYASFAQELQAEKEDKEKLKEQYETQIADLKQQIDAKVDEIEDIKSSVNNMQKQVDDLGRITPSRKTKNDIEKAINTYCKNDLNEEDMQKDYVIRNFALDIALENKKEFENTDEYLDSLIKKAKVKISLSGKSTEDLFNQIMEENDEEYVQNKEMTNAVREVMKTMTSNTELMEIIGDENYYELQDAIETHLKKSDYDITNLTDADKNEIVSEVLMEFV